ncbi:MAG: epoxyqueuosine reductase QueH [Acidobacteriota bacterium]
MKKLLLHICCAPCAVYVVRKLMEEYDVTGFFYNPNIHPVKEYEFRVEETKKVAEKLNWKVILSEYDIKNWFKLIRGHEKDPERGERCSICFNMRFDKVFQYAKENDFDMVASTLSISPYKAIDQINREGYLLSRKYGVDFLPENFKKRDGFKIGTVMSHDLGIKHQDYCGCVFSLRDRNRQLKK